MYSSGYSQVSKQSPQAKKKMQYRSKNKSCGYYMRIVFFFSSLIQSLIIVSLVLFLLYGKSPDTACAARALDLEGSFSRLSIENAALQQQRKDLTNMLNATTTHKVRCELDLQHLRLHCNKSIGIMLDYEKKMVRPHIAPGSYRLQLKAKLELLGSNFTSETRKMRMDMDQTAKERDNLNLEAIRLRKDKSAKEKELQNCQQQSKEDISINLGSVSKVTRALLDKIDSVFPKHVAFQLSCIKQQEHLEQIHNNCTSLSREVEGKLQNYLNGVAQQLFNIQMENNRLKSENSLLYDDYRWCSQNRSGLIEQHRQRQEEQQQKWDKDKERLLLEKMKLDGDMEFCKDKVIQMAFFCLFFQVGLPMLPPRPIPPNPPVWNRPIGFDNAKTEGVGLGPGSVGTNTMLNTGGIGPKKPEINQRDPSSMFKPLESFPKFGLDTKKPATNDRISNNFGSGPRDPKGGLMPALPPWFTSSGSQLGQSNSEPGRTSGGSIFDRSGSPPGQGRTTALGGGGQSMTDI
uniref:Plasmalemma vesicle associated protein a n=1 Tax=Oryzias latipes TaxID=8090 RepID=A0A3P9KUM0_ORYLA